MSVSVSHMSDCKNQLNTQDSWSTYFRWYTWDRLYLLFHHCSRDGSVGRLVHLFGPDWKISTPIGWTRFWTDFHGRQRMNRNDVTGCVRGSNEKDLNAGNQADKNSSVILIVKWRYTGLQAKAASQNRSNRSPTGFTGMGQAGRQAGRDSGSGRRELRWTTWRQDCWEELLWKTARRLWTETLRASAEVPGKETLRPDALASL